MKKFSDRVVERALEIPAGRVSTYGRIAKAAGGPPMAAQSVTAILGRAHEAGEASIPFHRIVYADGRIWVDEKHRAERMKIYKQEGIEIDAKDQVKNFAEVLYEFE